MSAHENTRSQRESTSGAHAGGGPATAQVVIDSNLPQFTLRAILTGMILGGLLSICNIYVSLKIGWSLNMSITAALLGFGIWEGLRAVFPASRPFNILENNINQTACSSGASISSAGLVAPIPALAMMTGETLSWAQLAIWVFSVCLVGILAAVVLRRPMLEVDKLPFPSGVASAEVLEEMYAKSKTALTSLYTLLVATGAGSLVKLLSHFSIVKPFPLSPPINGFSAKAFGLQFQPSAVLFAIGGLIGFRACWSLLLGGLVSWLVLLPNLLQRDLVPIAQSVTVALPETTTFPDSAGLQATYLPQEGSLTWRGRMSGYQLEHLNALCDDPDFLAETHELYARVNNPALEPKYGDSVSWLLWPGVAIMVLASLTSFAFSWPSVVALFRKSGAESDDDDDAAQGQRRDTLPVAWFVAGLAVALVLSVTLQMRFFGIMAWVAVVGVLLSFALAIVAARVSGETGVTPVGAMGKVTQLTFGAFVPGAPPASNLMTANVTGGAASQCADLLHDLKCGQLVGASPRLQAMAQVLGSLAGAAVGSAAYLFLIKDPRKDLLTADWPAPAVAAWKAVAELFQSGLEALPAGALEAGLVGVGIGILLPIIEKLTPAKHRRFIPSAASFGLGFVVPMYQGFMIFLGGLVALLFAFGWPTISKRFAVTIFAGLIAGESLVGTALALFETIPALLE